MSKWEDHPVQYWEKRIHGDLQVPTPAAVYLFQSSEVSLADFFTILSHPAFYPGCLGLLARKNLCSTDELRRAVEALSEEQSSALCYYGKWSVAMSNILMEKGYVSLDDLDRELGVQSEDQHKNGKQVSLAERASRCQCRVWWPFCKTSLVSAQNVCVHVASLPPP